VGNTGDQQCHRSPLAAALAAVDRPGDFYASGVTELHTPKLEVEGVGLVALPVLLIQVA